MERTFAQLTPHLWVAQSGLFHTNSGIFVSDGQACLVDPGIYPYEIEGIKRFLAEREASAQMIVLTHSHWDHILGPERFPGIRVVAHAGYNDIAREHAAVPLKSIASWEAKQGIQRDNPFAIPQPDETFDELLTLGVGSCALRLVHGPGHAPDQLVVYHADDATLWAADMLSDLEIPFVSHDLSAYQRTLDMLSELSIRVLVPGHGHATTDQQEIRTRIAEDIAYLAELRSRVEQALAEGKTVEETVAACSGMAFRNRAENEGPHRTNVESVYLELGGQCDPTTVGWAQEWPE
jgi:hydroxyacylglutathione hydrolase